MLLSKFPNMSLITMGLSLVVLSNLYAKERRWEGVGEVRKVMNKMGVSKEGGGRSIIELINEVHEFQMADRSKQIKYITI